MQLIDKFLDQITMYRLMLYYLIFLLCIAVVLSFFGLLPFNPFWLIISSLFLLTICWVVNQLFSSIFKAVTNNESLYISALILSLILSPARNLSDLIFLFWAASLAMTSKYIFIFHKKHLFNPVALSVVITAFALNRPASWWVGTLPMLPFVLVGGLLVVKKIQRFRMVLSFLLTSTLVILAYNFVQGFDLLKSAQKNFIETPVLFFAFVMLTEPLSTPPTKYLQMFYGGLVGLLFAPFIHLAGIYSTPELALVTGNIFSFIVSPKFRLSLKLIAKNKLGSDTYDFIFETDSQPKFSPGQYLEWTLATPKADSRGNRRYFTIASSPTEHNIRLGIKFTQTHPSSFKSYLLAMQPGQSLTAAPLSGDFTLPKDPAQKLVFMAGGIGITPFRSMIKYLIDNNQKRDIILLYSNKTAGEAVYQDIFDEASKKLGIKTVYVDTTKQGFIDEKMIKREVPDFKERKFYLSGPHSMVTAFESLLSQVGVPKLNIKTDFFPGYA